MNHEEEKLDCKSDDSRTKKCIDCSALYRCSEPMDQDAREWKMIMFGEWGCS